MPVVPLIVLLGSAFNFTLSVLVELHPKTFVPSTEYVVLNKYLSLALSLVNYVFILNLKQIFKPHGSRKLLSHVTIN